MKTMKEIWLKIWGRIKPIFTIKKIYSFLTSKFFLFLIILVLALMIGRSCARMKDNQRVINIYTQNISALTDTIRIEKTKSGKLELSIASYISSVKDLEILNNDLYKEIKDHRGTIISLNKIVIQLRQDTTILRKHLNHIESIMGQPIQLNDSMFQVPWLLTYNWDKMNFDVFRGQTLVGLTIPPGYTWRDVINPTLSNTTGTFSNNLIGLRHYNTEIVDRLSQIDLTFGQKIENDQLRIFASTNYPGFTASSLEGVLIDPNTNPYIKDLIKKKKWFPNMWSIGVGPSFGYNVFSNKLYLGIGVNVNYTLLQW